MSPISLTQWVIFATSVKWELMLADMTDLESGFLAKVFDLSTNLVAIVAIEIKHKKVTYT